MTESAESARLAETRSGTAWRRWGPYLTERQWGTVREDYSDDRYAWNCFTHEQSRSRAYRWGEDGLADISDDKARRPPPALWNGTDPILRAPVRPHQPEANHGEDVKECYYYLDATPCALLILKALYKYPQRAFPYDRLLNEKKPPPQNRKENRNSKSWTRTRSIKGRYFDVQVEYAKPVPEDIWIRITVSNRGPGGGPYPRAAHLVVPQQLGLEGRLGGEHPQAFTATPTPWLR